MTSDLVDWTLAAWDSTRRTHHTLKSTFPIQSVVKQLLHQISLLNFTKSNITRSIPNCVCRDLTHDGPGVPSSPVYQCFHHTLKLSCGNEALSIDFPDEIPRKKFCNISTIQCPPPDAEKAYCLCLMELPRSRHTLLSNALNYGFTDCITYFLSEYQKEFPGSSPVTIQS